LLLALGITVIFFCQVRGSVKMGRCT